VPSRCCRSVSGRRVRVSSSTSAASRAVSRLVVTCSRDGRAAAVTLRPRTASAVSAGMRTFTGGAAGSCRRASRVSSRARAAAAAPVPTRPSPRCAARSTASSRPSRTPAAGPVTPVRVLRPAAGDGGWVAAGRLRWAAGGPGHVGVVVGVVAVGWASRSARTIGANSPASSSPASLPVPPSGVDGQPGCRWRGGWDGWRSGRRGGGMARSPGLVGYGGWPAGPGVGRVRCCGVWLSAAGRCSHQPGRPGSGRPAVGRRVAAGPCSTGRSPASGPRRRVPGRRSATDCHARPSTARGPTPQHARQPAAQRSNRPDTTPRPFARGGGPRDDVGLDGQRARSCHRLHSRHRRAAPHLRRAAAAEQRQHQRTDQCGRQIERLFAGASWSSLAWSGCPRGIPTPRATLVRRAPDPPASLANRSGIQAHATVAGRGLSCPVMAWLVRSVPGMMRGRWRGLCGRRGCVRRGLWRVGRRRCG